LLLCKKIYDNESCRDKFTFFAESINFENVTELCEHLTHRQLLPDLIITDLKRLKTDFALLDIENNSILPVFEDIFNLKGSILYWKYKKYVLSFNFGNYHLLIYTRNMGKRAIILSKTDAELTESEGRSHILVLVRDMNNYQSDVYTQAKFDNRHIY